MKKIAIFNAYLPQRFATRDYVFEPVVNFDRKYREWEKRNKFARSENELLAYAIENSPTTPKSHFYPKQPKIWDYCALLSLFQSRNVFPAYKLENGVKTEDLFFRSGRSYDWPLLLFDEIRSHLEKSLVKLDKISTKHSDVFYRALQLFFEAEFFVKYKDLTDVWYLLAIEYFCRSVYCLEEKVSDWKKVTVPSGVAGKPKRPQLYDFFRYCVDVYKYDEYIKKYKTRADLGPFLRDIATLRNWVMHGKVWDIDIYSKYQNEYMFYHRVSGLTNVLFMSFLGINKFRNRDALLDGIVYGHAVCPLWQKD